MMKPILAAATIAMFAAPALAQQTPPADATAEATAKFAKHDTNNDEALSIAEVQVADSTVTEADFQKYDADANKSLSKDEFAKWLEAKATPPASSQGQ